ncbi:uncharacterized protein B0H18DRAFT_1046620 [Fomitopsis serialis]|uniref:uncharacterized protein n=1 Tax=Fomitopsis serialis TaxID=139415 RepID=UPI0020079239|nr:uncharacterized protein B0H18DRAFT_1046620 [Neoantrodia serialis]KAH9914107.1 hypothetical protein B0H18DRAFT_1046620 [Neoantrodia serialis]
MPRKSETKRRRNKSTVTVEPRNRCNVQVFDGSPTEKSSYACIGLGDATVSCCASLFISAVVETGSETGSDTESESGSVSDVDSDLLENEDDGTIVRAKHVAFKPGDSAILASKHDGTTNVWVGIITDLRATSLDDDDYEVWAKIHWCWSGSDLMELIKSFTSDWCTYEKAASLLAVKYLYEWDEACLDPPELQADTLYVRSILSHARKLVDPKPGYKMCMQSRCNQNGYNPFPSHLDEDQLDAMVMHFCPRLTCRQWYHQKCLVRWSNVEHPAKRYLGDRGVRLLAVDPDDAQDCPLLAYYTDGVKMDPDDDDEIRDDGNSDSGTTLPLPLDAVLTEMLRSDSIAKLPPALVRIAQCPIVRGRVRRGWLDSCWECEEVALARRLVYAAFEQDYIDDTWSTLDPQQLCDKIGTSFRYATPYLPYWQRREEELEDEDWMDQPPVVCPSCNGAI